MGKNKKLRTKQNKQYKHAKSLLNEYNQEVEQFKECKDADRLPQITYDKQMNCFVML